MTSPPPPFVQTISMATDDSLPLRVFTLGREGPPLELRVSAASTLADLQDLLLPLLLPAGASAEPVIDAPLQVGTMPRVSVSSSRPPCQFYCLRLPHL